jgi:hypothetical protein
MMGYYKSFLWINCIYTLVGYCMETNNFHGFNSKEILEEFGPPVYQIILTVALSVYIIISMFLFAQSVS